MEAPEHEHPRCSACPSTPSITYRCDDCQSGAHLCESCTLDAHRVLPFHRLRRWDSEAAHPHFEKVTLGDLDYEFCLGHDGLQCPSSDHSERKMDIKFVDIHGVFKIAVRFCVCPHNLPPSDPNSSHSYHNQLIRNRLYPASKRIPRYAYSFRLLRHFHRCNLSSKTAAYDYCEALKRLTDPVSPKTVSVRPFHPIVSSDLL